MTDCIEYQGSKDQDGYGRQWYNGQLRGAHRVAWMRERGPIPDGLFVLHGCDNPPCVNIVHLRLGTQSENIKESYAKGRKHSPFSK